VQQLPFKSKQAGHLCKSVPNTLCSHVTDCDHIRLRQRLTLLPILARQLRILAFCWALSAATSCQAAKAEQRLRCRRRITLPCTLLLFCFDDLVWSSQAAKALASVIELHLCITIIITIIIITTIMIIIIIVIMIIAITIMIIKARS
jgi:hypothetical protein